MTREVTNYEAMHNKVKRLKGRAAEHLCVDCNERQAAHWSLSHEAEDIRYQKGTNQDGRAFSLNVDDYEPRCRPCHSRYDAKHNLMRAPMGNRTGHKQRPKCTVSDCENLNKARGLCDLHYKRDERKRKRDGI